MPKAKTLILEMPINTGEFPDYIDPSHKRRIAGHTNPAMPNRHAEVLASKSYQEAMRKLARYTGGGPRQRGDLPQMVGMMMQALQSVAQIEAGHEEELEQAAVHLVLNLPEFEAAKAAVEAGDLRVRAQLTSRIDLEGARLDAEEQDDNDDLQIAEIAAELDVEAKKRAFINMLIQGNAMNKMQAYHMASEELNAIDPRLLNLYGVLTSVGTFSYWIMPEQQQRQMMQGGQGAGGAAHVKPAEDGVPEVIAQGITFPMLVHELVKGLMEYISFDEDTTPEMRKYASGQADTLTNELLDIKIGPAAWQDIVSLIPEQRLIPYVYDHLVKLPATEFNNTMRTLMQGGRPAEQAMQMILQRIRQNNATEESVAALISRHLLN